MYAAKPACMCFYEPWVHQVDLVNATANAFVRTHINHSSYANLTMTYACPERPEEDLLSNDLVAALARYSAETKLNNPFNLVNSHFFYSTHNSGTTS
jgi:hypothetical protein